MATPPTADPVAMPLLPEALTIAAINCTNPLANCTTGIHAMHPQTVVSVSVSFVLVVPVALAALYRYKRSAFDPRIIKQNILQLSAFIQGWSTTALFFKVFITSFIALKVAFVGIPNMVVLVGSTIWAITFTEVVYTALCGGGKHHHGYSEKSSTGLTEASPLLHKKHNPDRIVVLDHMKFFLSCFVIFHDTFTLCSEHYVQMQMVDIEGSADAETARASFGWCSAIWLWQATFVIPLWCFASGLTCKSEASTVKMEGMCIYILGTRSSKSLLVFRSLAAPIFC
jgi:hypothetical protein